jgi:hypothetical protein
MNFKHIDDGDELLDLEEFKLVYLAVSPGTVF